MSKAPPKPLDHDLLKVLYAVARTDLSTASAIAHIYGGGVHEPLIALRNQGYVREQPGHQNGGGLTTLYSVTPEGAKVLEAAGQLGFSVPALAAAPSAPPRSLYEGHELRPYLARPGAMDAFKFPSRMGARLFHPDGSVTPI